MACVASWEVDYESIIFARRLGVGAWGEVFEAKWQGAACAVKRLLPERTSTESLEEFRKPRVCSAHAPSDSSATFGPIRQRNVETPRSATLTRLSLPCALFQAGRLFCFRGCTIQT